MGTKELRKRKIWQDVSGGKAGIAEKSFYQVFSQYFEGSDFRIRKKPKEFNICMFYKNFNIISCKYLAEY